MLSNLEENFKKVNCDIVGFMLLKINLPDHYDNSIVATQVMKQEAKTYTKLLDV